MGASSSCPRICDPPDKCREICKSVEQEGGQPKLIPIVFDDQNYIYPVQTDERLQTSLHKKVLHTIQTNSENENESKKREENSVREIVILGSQRVGLDSMVSSKSENHKIEAMQIPFSVIKLTVDEELLEEINKRKPNFIPKQLSTDLSRNWRLTKTGAYKNFINKSYGTILTRTSFYEGYFLYDEEQDQDHHIPDVRGLYISKSFIYNGELTIGKAHGKGKLFLNQENEEQIYEGTWEEGILMHGNIKTREYEYSGDFMNGRPNGEGELKTKEGIWYVGKFQEGLFNDENATYETRKYTYRGGFKNGKKNGYGKIDRKKQNTVIEGVWRDDQIEIADLEND